jgi:hypothetical protein
MSTFKVGDEIVFNENNLTNVPNGTRAEILEITTCHNRDGQCIRSGCDGYYKIKILDNINSERKRKVESRPQCLGRNVTPYTTELTVKLGKIKDWKQKLGM